MDAKKVVVRDGSSYKVGTVVKVMKDGSQMIAYNGGETRFTSNGYVYGMKHGSTYLMYVSDTTLAGRTLEQWVADRNAEKAAELAEKKAAMDAKLVKAEERRAVGREMFKRSNVTQMVLSVGTVYVVDVPEVNLALVVRQGSQSFSFGDPDDANYYTWGLGVMEGPGRLNGSSVGSTSASAPTLAEAVAEYLASWVVQ